MKYQIKGDTLPVVICQLEGGESMITERGSMAWMSPNMKMDTTTNGGIGKAFGRMFGPGQEYIFQKSAFLAAESGVSLSMHFQKRVSSGLFGGEGFILQRVSGQGTVFAEFDGHVVEYELQPGQQIVIDSGYLAAMSVSCQMEIKTIQGLKNVVFGGEGLFNTVVTGPGHVWLQTMPINAVAGALRPYFPSTK